MNVNRDIRVLYTIPALRCGDLAVNMISYSASAVDLKHPKVMGGFALTCGNVCGALSWLMVDMGEPLWAVPAPGW